MPAGPSRSRSRRWWAVTPSCTTSPSWPPHIGSSRWWGRAVSGRRGSPWIGPRRSTSWPSAAAWSSWRRSAIPPASAMRSRPLSTSPIPPGWPRSSATASMLLVLDNCEHVITTAAEVAEDLLRRCPNLRLIATSREGLRVAGEHIWPVPPLAAEDAVGLFVTRARAVGASMARLRRRSRPHRPDLRRDSTGCRSPSSWRRRAPGRSRSARSRLGCTTASACSPAGRARRSPVSRRCGRWSTGATSCSSTTSSGCSSGCRCSRAVVTWRRRRRSCPTRRSLSLMSPTCSRPWSTSPSSSPCPPETGCGTRSSRRFLTTARRSSPSAATPSEPVTRCRRTTPGCARRARPPSPGRSNGSGSPRSTRSTTTSRPPSTGPSPATTRRPRSTIAGGASWPHWLTGTIIEGKQWLDDAFACSGEADELTRALALTGRGLIDFLAGQPEHSDADLKAAIDIFERHGDLVSMVLVHSFYAEKPAVLGDIDEARRRRLAILNFYADQPDDEFVVPARSYSLAKLALMEGDLQAAESHYRAATEGFARLDRPVMVSMCLGMVADFDERAGDFPAAIATLEAAIETNEALIGGFTGSLLSRLGWVLLLDGQLERSEEVYRARPRLRPTGAALHGGLPGPHRPRRAASPPRARRGRRRGRFRGDGDLLGWRAPPVPEPCRPRRRHADGRRRLLHRPRRHRRGRGRTRRGGRPPRGGGAPPG